jgi:hypothetical protein
MPRTPCRNIARKSCGAERGNTERPARPENCAYNGHFESTCNHPVLLFNREGDGLAAKPRPGNVHGADAWEELLLPQIECQ